MLWGKLRQGLAPHQALCSHAGYSITPAAPKKRGEGEMQSAARPGLKPAKKGWRKERRTPASHSKQTVNHVLEAASR